MIKHTNRFLLATLGYVCSAALPVFADELKCTDAQKELRQNIDPIVETEIKAAFPNLDKKYTISYKNFYSPNETDNLKDCVATVDVTMDDGLNAGAEVKYRLVATEDGQVLTQLQDFNRRGLVAGILMASIRRAQSGMPADQAAKEFYAPQGPGSIADQNRKYNREHNSGARKSSPQE